MSVTATWNGSTSKLSAISTTPTPATGNKIYAKGLEIRGTFDIWWKGQTLTETELTTLGYTEITSSSTSIDAETKRANVIEVIVDSTNRTIVDAGNYQGN